MPQRARKLKAFRATADVHVVEIDEKHIAFRDGELWRPAILREHLRDGSVTLCRLYMGYAPGKKMPFALLREASYAEVLQYPEWDLVGSRSLDVAVRFALRRKASNVPPHGKAFPLVDYILPPDLVHELAERKLTRLSVYQGNFFF